MLFSVAQIAINTTTQSDFLLWREPNETQIVLFTLTNENTAAQDVVVLAPFLGPKTVFAIAEKTEVSEAQLSNLEFPELNIASKTEETSRSSHLALVSEAVKQMQNNAFKKVVLARTKVLHHTPDIPTLFLKFSRAYPSACVFLFCTAGAGCWMGATPETLLHVAGNTVSANSLAGTRPAGSAQVWGQKEKQEQQFVTDEIAEVFRASGVSEITFQGPNTRHAGPVEHLFTEVGGTKPASLKPTALASKLHPTPAVGGLPRKEAIAFIGEFEPIKRDYYCGYLGVSTQKKSTFYVNLRSMQLFKNSLILYAGGGITAASDPELEWDETERKLQTLLAVINEEDS